MASTFKRKHFYIFNNLKLNIIDNEQNKTILHIFNSKSILDGNSTDNLPIGLFGKFYSMN